MEILLQDLKKAFGKMVAVDIPQFTIHSGDILGLVGNNGAGKTTLFRLLLDLIEATEGHVQMTFDSITDKQTGQHELSSQEDGSLVVDPARSETWKKYTGAYIDEGFLINFLTPEEYLDFIAKVNGMPAIDWSKTATAPEHTDDSEATSPMKQHQSADNSQGQLYIVPTPIGNLADITQRALEVLQAVDLIAAEDTRHTGLLLQHFGINARLFALHDHNEQQKAETLLAKLQEGQNIALVSDAGTPLINDPGYHLVRTCREAGIRVVPLPGPCAAITALSAAGLPSDRFCYEGFLPAKSKGRRDALKAIEAEPRTLIFYESTHRLLDSLEDIVAVLGESRYVVLARELTKTWETIHGAPVGELLAWVKEDENRRKGEMVLIVEGHKAQEEDLPADALRTLALLQAELPLKKAAALAAEIHGVKKNALYKYALEQQGE